MRLLSQYRKLANTKARYFLLTGGRGSGKSFHVSAFLVNLTYEPGHVILYTRYTMKSAWISIIPEFKDKIDRMNCAADFHITKDEIVNVLTGSRILFRGIKTSEGNQTANLKSIQGVTTWVLDEAEELVEETIFDTIDLSIRSIERQNRVILILNPSHKKHWIYRRFVKSQHPATIHIHTTYLDNIHNLSQSFLDSAEFSRTKDCEKYAHIFLGEWRESGAGLIYPKYTIQGNFPNDSRHVYGLDFGFVDPCACAKVWVTDGTIYIQEVLYQTGLTPEKIADKLLAANIPRNSIIYADSADPGKIQLIKKTYNRMMPATKGPDSIETRINYVQSLEIVICGESPNIIREIESYEWKTMRDGTIMDGVPTDGNDHILDAIGYAAYSHFAKSRNNPGIQLVQY